MTGVFIQWAGDDFRAYWQQHIQDFVERDAQLTRSTLLPHNRKLAAAWMADRGKLPPASDLINSAFTTGPRPLFGPASWRAALGPDLRDLPPSLPAAGQAALQGAKELGVLRPEQLRWLRAHERQVMESVIDWVSDALSRTKKPGAWAGRTYKRKEIAKWAKRAREGVWAPPGEEGYVLPVGADSPLIFMANLEDEAQRGIVLGAFLSSVFSLSAAAPDPGSFLAFSTLADIEPEAVTKLDESNERIEERPGGPRIRVIMDAAVQVVKGMAMICMVDLAPVERALNQGDVPGLDAEVVRAVERHTDALRPRAERLDRECLPEQKLAWFASEGNSAVFYQEDDWLSEYLLEVADVPRVSTVSTRSGRHAEVPARAAGRVLEALAGVNGPKRDAGAVARLGSHRGVDAATASARIDQAAQSLRRPEPRAELSNLLARAESGAAKLAYLWWDDKGVPDLFMAGEEP